MRELEEEGVRVEKERREEREGMAEQLRKNELLIERYTVTQSQYITLCMCNWFAGFSVS